MNRDQIESDWNQFRGSAKQQWCTPSDDLLDMIAGKRNQPCRQDPGNEVPFKEAISS